VGEQSALRCRLRYPRYPSDGGLSEPQSQSGGSGGEQNCCHCRKTKPGHTSHLPHCPNLFLRILTLLLTNSELVPCAMWNTHTSKCCLLAKLKSEMWQSPQNGWHFTPHGTKLSIYLNCNKKMATSLRIVTLLCSHFQIVLCSFAKALQ
jgi:hypothetical protein